MELIFDKSLILSRMAANFKNKTVTLELMTGVLPTESEVYDMTTSTRTSERVKSLSIALDANGYVRYPSLLDFTPDITGTITWARFSYSGRLIATDKVGVAGGTGEALVILEKLDVTQGIQTYLMAAKIGIQEVA